MTELDPDDPLLAREDAAPHELCGVMRWHRAGVPSKEIMSMLRLRGTKLAKVLQAAADEEREAVRSRRPIHDALIPKDKT